MRPTADLEPKDKDVFWKSDPRLSVPAIFPGQATAIAMGNEYTHPFSNTWIYELDDDDQDDCAMEDHYTRHASYEEEKPRNVCEHCKGFTKVGEELMISRKILEENAWELNCALCQMIDEELDCALGEMIGEELKPSIKGELTLFRSVAGIQLKGRERPLVRICQTPKR